MSRPSDTVKQEVSRRCQALASFMETLMDEVSRADLKLELPHENELTVSERDSVMLGRSRHTMTTTTARAPRRRRRATTS